MQKTLDHELYIHVGNITDILRKGRIIFYGYSEKIRPMTLTNNILTHFLKETPEAWFTEAYEK